jgi:hypothetical protein
VVQMRGTQDARKEKRRRLRKKALRRQFKRL